MHKTQSPKEKIKSLLRKGLNAKTVARAAQCSLRKVYYYKKELIEELQKEETIFAKKSVPMQKKCKLKKKTDSVFYRVHDMTISLPIHYASKTFKRRLKKGNIARVRGHSAQLFPSRVVLRGSKGFCFEAKTHAQAFDEAMSYWEGVIRVLEQRWGLVLWKRDGVFGFTFETAEVNNGLATDCVARKEYIKIRDEEEGKVWALVDASTGLPEFEAVDSVRAGDDMERVLVPFFNDLRAHAGSLLLPSQVHRLHADLLEQHARLVAEVARVNASVSELASLERMRFASVLAASGGLEVREDERRPDYIR